VGIVCVFAEWPLGIQLIVDRVGSGFFLHDRGDLYKIFFVIVVFLHIEIF
jgi:hypothetical protein